MGLQATLQKAAQTAIKAVGDAAVDATYVSMADQSQYDTGTGVVTNIGTEYDDVSMVFTEFDEREVDGEKVLDTDERALIANLDLTPTPKPGDRIHKSATDHWKVKAKKTDPVSALWILHIRKVPVVTIVAPEA